IQSYKDLIVWQRAIDLTLEIYTVTKIFPQDERFGLVSQLRRAGVSIASNIAEGRHRSGTKDYIRFLRIALGSVAELETQLTIAHKLGLIVEKDFSSIMNLSLEITKMLKVLIGKLLKKLTLNLRP